MFLQLLGEFYTLKINKKSISTEKLAKKINILFGLNIPDFENIWNMAKNNQNSKNYKILILPKMNKK